MNRTPFNRSLLVAALGFITLSATNTSAFFFGGNCEAPLLKKRDYVCTLEASDDTRSDEVLLAGSFVDYDGNSNPFAPPFLFEFIFFESTFEVFPADGVAPLKDDVFALACGCDPKGFSDPRINASHSFTCVGNAPIVGLGGSETIQFSFSGTEILGGNSIQNANTTIFIEIDQEPYVYSNVKGKCKPGTIAPP